MSVGLIALLDDVALIARTAAASLDDVAGQAMKAGTKSAGVIIDDAAVTPRYMTGFAAERELPIVIKIAKGSLKNKLIFLLPAALLLGAFAPWAVTPLLMLGGLFLCYEGAEKVMEVFFPHGAQAHEEKIGAKPVDPENLEKTRVASAIKTDFILSAEIMAITLSAVPGSGFWTQAVVLALVGTFITLLVYGAVALIVKADDIGVALASREGAGIVSRTVGRGLVAGMPYLLTTLAIVGTAAMIWVGGGIIAHGLGAFGLHAFEHAIEGAATAAAGPDGFAHWLVGAVGYGVFGLAIGAATIPVVERAVAPVWERVSGWM